LRARQTPGVWLGRRAAGWVARGYHGTWIAPAAGVGAMVVTARRGRVLHVTFVTTRASTHHNTVIAQPKAIAFAPYQRKRMGEQASHGVRKAFFASSMRMLETAQLRAPRQQCNRDWCLHCEIEQQAQLCHLPCNTVHSCASNHTCRMQASPENTH
jgi:hypothetical protein